jgi:Ca2+-binding RTX toxin-like protein
MGVRIHLKPDGRSRRRIKPHPRGIRRSGAFAATALLAGLLAIGAAVAGTSPSASAAPQVSAGQGFLLTPSDLKFILKQIKIAENNATTEDPLTGEPVAGQPLFGTGPNQIGNALLPYGLRTVDGTYNNLQPGQSHFGASHQKMPRLAPAQFRVAEDSNIPGMGPVGPPGLTSYAQKKGNVVDSQPRVISNLIVDQTANNPAAILAAGRPNRHFNPEPSAVPCDEFSLPAGCVPLGETLFIPNVTTDVGLSPPFNSWFTIFGQFFDHGLDSTRKSGGMVFVPLKADDPLITHGPDGIAGNGDEVPVGQRFMVITRATNQPGPDGVVGDVMPTTTGVGACTSPNVPAGCDESIDDVQDATNTDTPWVDQNQTYTSHSSHQVFLRAYANNVDGMPVATGRLIEGDVGGMATWKNVKDQAATVLGIQLTDADALNIPMVAADQYGRYLRGPARGLPQLVTTGGLVEGDANSPIAVPANVVRINAAFFDDIAHNAVPKPGLTPDLNTGITGAHGMQPAGTYDDEMLDIHFAAGDGRANENIALTAIHQVFHSEHNRLIGQIQDVLNADTSPSGLLAIEEWKLATGADGWNGERLFQAARFVTEMEYQHLVFEEFARHVQPLINPFNVFTQSDTGINPAIRAEFAHAVYRFGHSMLTETVARTNPSGTSNDIPLLDAFLNPPSYFDDGASGTLTPAEAAGSIAQGMTDQVGNEIDEFVTEALRNNLLGLPLDLPTINMARAREAGVPSLNNFRKEIHAATNDSALQPYTSWVDFGLALKHPQSIVNFMAAYGKHSTITGATTAADKRAAAQLIYDQGPGAPLDSVEFINSTGVDWSNMPDGTSRTGLDDVDLWVGGLAEAQNLFGGLLGSTFNYVFERQLTDLQDGDRLYYLSRTSGMNLRTSLEGNSFGELVMRNTSAVGLKADVFGTADCEFDLANLVGTGNLVADDLTSECDEERLLIRMADGTIRYRPQNSLDPPGLNAQSIYNGTDNADRMAGGVDNDTFWGLLGNDRIEGGDGSDVALGGEGDDIITDSAGDDIHKGGNGNDAIDTGPGIDVIMSGEGKDFVNGGLNDNQTFAGEDDDFVISGDGPDTVFGGGGSDWEEGGNANDLLQGDSGAPFFDDVNVPGHDVLIGGSGEDDYDAEGGDDIMVAGPGIERNHGTFGFDWTTQVSDPIPGFTDLTIHVNAAPGQLADRFLLTEAASGWNHNDVIKGDDWVPLLQDVELHGPWGANALTTEGIARISGLAALVQGNTECVVDPQIPGDEGEGGPPASGPPITVCGFGEGNILIGGGGSDEITGRGANDIIDGDRWLNVRLSVRTDPSDPTTEYRTANRMAELSPAVFAGTLNPGNIVIVREILGPPAGDAGVDTAVYSGPQADYDIVNVNATTMTVTHARNLPGIAGDQGIPKGDGSDTLYNIERLQFTDQVVEVGNIPTNTPPAGTVNLSTTTPVEGQAVTATQAFTDADGINAGTLVFRFEAETSPGSWTTVSTGATFTPTNAVVGQALRVVATYTDGDGVLESVTSAATAAVANVNDAPTGQPVVSDSTPQETVALSADTFSIADADGLGAFSYQWQQSGLNGVGAFNSIANTPAGFSTGATFTPGQGQVNRALRVVVSYTDAHGTAEQLVSPATGVTGDLFIGNAVANNWTGTAGDDVARGGGANDTLNSLGGNDVVSGDAGDDTINTGSGDDAIEFSGNSNGFDAVVGGPDNDQIRATSGGTVVGLRSINTVESVTDNGFGPIQIQGSAANNTLNFSAVTLTNVTNIMGGSGNDNLTGSSAGDVLSGGGGNDAISGGPGADTVTGGVGNDALNGNAGNDTIEGRGGNDTVNGGADDDAVRFNGTGLGFDAVNGGTDSDRLEAMANNTVIGLRNTYTGVEAVDTNGHTGVSIQGSANADNLSFSGDTVSANLSGIDTNGGTDTLVGTAMDDVLTGGIGNDNVTGGAGDDEFRFAAGFGNDTLPGFDSNAAGGQDRLDLRPLGITAATFNAQVNIQGPPVAPAGGTRVTIGGNTITLPGVAVATVTQADFILAP